MFGDVGQGILLSLSIVSLKKRKMWLKIIIYRAFLPPVSVLSRSGLVLKTSCHTDL
jgi:hypothetical protein